MAKTPFSADYIHKLLKTIPEAERSKFLEMLEEQPIIGAGLPLLAALLHQLCMPPRRGESRHHRRWMSFVTRWRRRPMSSHPPLHQRLRRPRGPHPQPHHPRTPLVRQLRRRRLPLPKPPCRRSNPRQNPRAHQPQHRHRQARHLRKIRPRLLHLSWMRIRQGPLPVPRHKVPLQRRRELPLLLQMPPLPELALSSTMAPATPRFASFNSGRAGRSVAHVKTLSVRRRSPTAVTAFTQCTAAGTARGRRAATALTRLRFLR